MPPLPLPSLTSKPIRHPDCCLSLSTTLLTKILDHAACPSSPSTAINNTTTPIILSIGSGSGLLEALLNSHVSPSSSFSVAVEGVEVHQQQQQQQQHSSSATLNRYLEESRRRTVRGTWELHSARALEGGRKEGEEGGKGSGEVVVALMFAYPRKPELVKRYVEGAAAARKEGNGRGGGGGVGGGIRRIIWLGPQADWEDFRSSFDGVVGVEVDGSDTGEEEEEEEEEEGGEAKENNKERIKVLVGEEAGLAGYEMMVVVSL